MLCRLYLFLFIVCSSFKLYAQLTEQFALDSLPEQGRIDQCIEAKGQIFTGGMSIDNLKAQAVIRKLDTLGRVQWSTSVFDTLMHAAQPRCEVLYYGKDDYLYAIFSFERSTIQYWRIDPQSGKILYKQSETRRYGYTNLTQLESISRDTLVFLYNEDYPAVLYLGIWETKTGNITRVNLGNVPERYFHLTVNTSSRKVYYSKRDTLFGLDLRQSTKPQWSTQFPGEEYTVIAKLNFDEQEQALFCFGVYYPHRRGATVSKVNPNDGQIQWSTLLPQSSDYNFVATDLDDRFVYTSWKNIQSDQINMAISKLDKKTGEVAWSRLHRYIANVPQDQEATTLLATKGSIYLSGYYSVSDKPADWGVIKLDASTGAKVFTTRITQGAQLDQSSSQGIGVFSLKDRLLCIGNQIYRTYLQQEMVVTLDPQTGEIKETRAIGGLAEFNAETTHIETIDHESFIAIQQLGNIPMITLLDSAGRTTWRGLLPEEYRVKVVKVLADTLILIASKVVYFFNPKTKLIRNMGVISVDFRADSLSIIDLVADPSLKRFYMTYHSLSKPFYEVNLVLVYATGLTWSSDRVLSMNGTNPDVLPSNQLMIDLDDQAFACITQGAISRIDKMSFRVSEFRYPFSLIFTHLAKFQQDRILATSYDDQDNVVLTMIDQSSLAAIWFDTLKIQGKSIKWVQGEQHNIVYIACSYARRLLTLIKYDTDARKIIWTKLLRDELLGNVYFTDVSFNTHGQYVMLSGYLQQNLQSRQVLLIAVDAEGSVLNNLTQVGDFSGNSQALVVHASRYANLTLVGGALTRKPQRASSAFIYTFLGDASVQNAIKGQVFWDENRDGIQNSGEKGVALGQIVLNVTSRLYLTDDGSFKALVAAGRYTVRFRVPENWTLTTQEFTYQVDASQFQNLKDTLRFGVSPVQKIDRIELFTTSTPLICEEISTVFINIRNSGTTYQDLRIRVTHQGRPVFQSVPPDSIRFEKIYWTLDSLAPGSSRWLSLSFIIPSINSIGDSLDYQTTAYWNGPVGIDSVRYRYAQLHLCAYDPNDKLGRTSKLEKGNLTLFDQFFYYTIRFQNTGNYPARNITIIDTLDRDLEFGSFQFLGASHPITEIVGKNNIIRFVFKGINLPDSTSNEMDSHGFVSFRIKDRAGLEERTPIHNTAYIYFDQNPPIVTNTTQHILVSSLEDLTTSIKKTASYARLRLYPNPAQTNFIIEVPIAYWDLSGRYTWQLYNALGEKVREGVSSQPSFKVPIQHLANGIYYFRLNGMGTVKVLIVH